MNPPNSPKVLVADASKPPADFIRDIVAKHVTEGRYPRIHTRFPPEPNGYLHIGHAKSICLNFGIAREFGGVCNLRLDDTNPTKEDTEYVDSIKKDVEWLIAGWAKDHYGLKPKGKLPEAHILNSQTDYCLPAVVGETEGSHLLEPFYASDYFGQLYEYALTLIRKGKAYVCDLSAADTNAYRGAPDRPGKESPFRNRSIKENLDLFARMRDGEFPDGTRTLRAKIDMASPNVWMRDPVLYRIRHAEHHHTGCQWCVYPMYDFAHCLSDYIEGITHSICTLEFEVHRPLYDWILENLDLPRPVPRQYEFARLNLGYTVMSKRKLMQLVCEGHVSGWDDPRMPTICGLRRRGVTPEALRDFAYNIGITKYNALTDVAVLEFAIRNDLNRRALRRLAVLRPLRVLIMNYPEGQTEEFEAINNPENETAGKRKIPFGRELFIERDDFMETPPPEFFRLRPGGEVRLKYAYIIKCDEVVKDLAGNITELRCTADLESKTGGATAGRKVKGTIHWVSASHAIDAECRLYDHLFTIPEPDAGGDFKQYLNPHSLEVVTAKCEPSLAYAEAGERYQFERLGYFALDSDSSPAKPVFNRTTTLKDRWAKLNRQNPVCPSKATLNQPIGRLDQNLHSLRKDQINVRGRLKQVEYLEVGDKIITITGKWIKTAVVKGELWLENDPVENPTEIIEAIRNSSLRADIFSFGQRPPETEPKHQFFMEWDNYAVVQITSFKHWREHQIAPDARQNTRRAWRKDLNVKRVFLDDDVVRGIKAIYDETPVRQGKPFYHYGKDFETVRRQNSTYLDHTEFFGAYYENEMIGFLQLTFMRDIADIKQLLSMSSHYDKKPGNALLAKAVEACAERRVPLLMYGKYHYYGNQARDSLKEFKARHGFRQMFVPRYYVPLTPIGRLALALRLHKEWKYLIPESALRRAIRFRNHLFELKAARVAASARRHLSE